MYGVSMKYILCIIIALLMVTPAKADSNSQLMGSWVLLRLLSAPITPLQIRRDDREVFIMQTCEDHFGVYWDDIYTQGDYTSMDVFRDCINILRRRLKK
jgi:hypothetical protein